LGDSLPVGIRAYYARITGEMRKHGPNLGMPYTPAIGDELFEIRAKGKEGIARIFYCTVLRSRIIICTALSRRRTRRSGGSWLRPDIV
jgi:phage-related protein